MVQNPQNVSKNIPSGRIIFHSKVQNLAVFSIVYMIRLRFSGPRELFKRRFRAHGKWPAASEDYSYRISECREAVRAQLLRDSTDSGWEWKHFCSACRSSGQSGLEDAGR